MVCSTRPGCCSRSFTRKSSPRRCLFGSVGLTLMFASLMVSTATIILGGIPAAIYEHVIGAKEDSTEVSLWIWLAGTALLTLPAMGNFFKIGL